MVVLGLVVVSVVPSAAMPTAAHRFAAPAHVPSADVHGDNGADRYVGTGGLILPASVGPSARTRVATCPDCHWRMSSPCAVVTAGTPFPGQVTCLSVTRGCPGGAELLRVWFQSGGGPWEELGLVCLPPGGPVTVTYVAAAVQTRFVKDLPPLRPAHEPVRGVLTQLPVVFASGQPAGPLEADYSVLGQAVHLIARPTWAWDYGDGGLQTTSRPGGPYPDLSVSHVYRVSGPRLVRVATAWTATFTVDDLGPFPILEPVSQEAASAVLIGEGRAVLAVR